MSKLHIEPCTLKEANSMVEQLHRHHKPVRGHRFSLSCLDGARLCGVAICGRPVARACDQKFTLEITRCATDGTKNAISKLYGAIYRTAKAMGFKKIQTYTLPEEGGASLKASGFTCVAETNGGLWTNRPGRRSDQPTGMKWRWEIIL